MKPGLGLKMPAFRFGEIPMGANMLLMILSTPLLARIREPNRTFVADAFPVSNESATPKRYHFGELAEASMLHGSIASRPYRAAQTTSAHSAAFWRYATIVNSVKEIKKVSPFQ